MRLPLLDFDSNDFPDIKDALDEPNGLLAVGGDLSVERLTAAYRRGIFPWFNPDEPILWWAPAPRSVLFPNEIHISKSTKKAIKRSNWHVSIDTQFHSVIQSCSQTRKDEGTWICNSMIAAYNEMYHAGMAHSFEVWDQEELVGGLYGIQVGKVFFGESMFSRQSNASKTAVLLLKQTALKHGIELIDCQLQSDHLDTLGAVELNREKFRGLLNKLCPEPANTLWRTLLTPAQSLLGAE